MIFAALVITLCAGNGAECDLVFADTWKSPTAAELAECARAADIARRHGDAGAFCEIRTEGER